MSQFKLLYDGACPMCRREAQWLKRRDRQGRLLLEDIADPSFCAESYGLSRDDVMAVIQGVMSDGRVVRRLDALCEAYRSAGLGWLIAPLSWPVLHGIADRLYGVFARNRLTLGRLLGRSCDTGSCARRSS
jgi:predicted DCC family thiol-disulfide oxidoreductase YuxK